MQRSIDWFDAQINFVAPDD